MTATRVGSRSWPPYSLIEESLIVDSAARLDKLERLYHVGQDNIWDGRQVLAELIAKHGRPRLPPQQKESALKVLSVLLWGELAAWAISADLAERIDDIEAKMAATSQAHDEARHFYVLRDYLRALGEPVPRLGGIARRLLLKVLKTPSLPEKLIGMQLLTESNALGIFRGLVEAHLEPVLTELLPYYEKDEARHVGLGVMYLPRLLRQLSPLELAGVLAFQMQSLGMLVTGGLTMHPHFRALGMEPRKMARYTVGLQDQVMRDMMAEPALPTQSKPRDAVRGLLNPAQGLGPKVLDFIHPPDGIEQAPRWHRAALRVCTRGADLIDRALA
jgi:hypothetical protein